MLYESLSRTAREKRFRALDFPANPSALSREIGSLQNILKDNERILFTKRILSCFSLKNLQK